MKLIVPDKFNVTIPDPVVTLQQFITNRCNKRCKGCFYQDYLNISDMSIDQYKDNMHKFGDEINYDKVILLGGEPTMHPDLSYLLDLNRRLGIKTTIYTNGFNLHDLKDMNLSGVSVRIGVLGLHRSEKPLDQIIAPKFPVGIVYMLRRDNIDELMNTFIYANENFNLKYFYISSIRDIEVTGSFWKDTDETIPNGEYLTIVTDFINNLPESDTPIHISRRGVVRSIENNGKVVIPDGISNCRFFNVFPDRKPCMCPFDISLGIIDNIPIDRHCQKSDECLLQKIILTPNKTN